GSGLCRRGQRDVAGPHSRVHERQYLPLWGLRRHRRRDRRRRGQDGAGAMKPFSYARPGSAADAVAAFAAAEAAPRYVAGGTTLYDLMKLEVERPGHLIDITGIPGLDEIVTRGERL